MMKKYLSIVSALMLSVSVLTGCGNNSSADSLQQESVQEAAVVEEAANEAETENENNEAEEAEQVSSEENADTESSEDLTDESAKESEADETSEAVEETAENTDDAEDNNTSEALVRVGSLKGPTTMGLVNLMKDSENGESEGKYEFTMATQPDELMAGIVAGNIDIALVPANMASVLYNKTEGDVSLVDINTLGVLYCVTGDETVKSVKDLAGKTVITTGQGASPEYVLRYLLDKNEVTDCNIEFKSEATEIAAILNEDATKVAILPQPFVTVATAKNDSISVAFSLTDEWDAVSDGSKLLTGVTVVRNEFLSENADAVNVFLEDHVKSAEKAVSDVDTTAELVAEYGIIEKAEIAKKALPECNIVCISDEAAKTALSGYLQVLFDQDPKSVGGKLPEDDFYTLSK
ncbi:ABC transporter substrate-binding protein [Butyrivibrio sp. WCE2006]|uniref:ABC transporter substrate-binding protein n=1 Tax=Butyrivibrio sp. WCE2006 TaxID=1410611 RepID=UPI001FA6BA56|nr:MqnA/MqnD/SBP family protein [Butyrivibrio sp. WCE2006]